MALQELNIIDLETLLGYTISTIDFQGSNVQYSFGNESHLKEWLRKRGEMSDANGLYTDLGDEVSFNKYPLVYLVKPFEGEHRFDFHRFSGVQIIIGCNTNPEWLNETRWKGESEYGLSTISILSNVANLLIERLKNGYVSLIRTSDKFSYRYAKYENYSVEDQSKSSKGYTIDHWDAIKLTCDLKATTNCLESDYLNYCSNVKIN